MSQQVAFPASARSGSRAGDKAGANNLPLQLTSFVGRHDEIAELARLIANTRILTLTGAGGVGKTRLAIETARRVLEHYPDGVWLVELAPLSDPALIPSELAAVLGVREQRGKPLVESVVDHLRLKNALIVFDNCEHLLASSATLVDVLVRSCPNIRALATSREVLSIEGETSWRVPSLSMPALPFTQPERLAGYEAIQLFVDRARAALPSFELTEANGAGVTQICARLDGIPLAIELAAPRVKILSVEQIAARLVDVFRLLTGGSRTALQRQQTLRATVDWSYDLLSADEQRLFNRLSVFAGGWTIDAAEAVCSGDRDQDVLDVLARLVDKSLVVAAQSGDEVRYRLLEPMRQYAAEMLDGAGESDAVHRRHFDWFLGFAREAERERRGPNAASWVQRLEIEHDNLRAANEWIRTHGVADDELDLCATLAWFWWFREYMAEGRERLARALERPDGSSQSRMRALASAGSLAHYQRDSALATSLGEQSLAIARELRDDAAIAWALHLLGRVRYYDGDSAAATELGRASLAAAQVSGDLWLEGWAYHLLALAAHVGGDYPTARSHYVECLRVRGEIGDVCNSMTVQSLLGALAHYEGSSARPPRSTGRRLRFPALLAFA